ncbi:MAG TPA: serine/threonine-protein kinase, partial [Nannocystaceae bacterium]|nr:serine/threonine-protein kinase [Nannocystaceae bacterium]
MQVAAALFGDAPPTPAIGRFLLQRMIGAGGMGIVYAATDPQLGRTVALKLIQPTSAGERATERLLREAQAMARLQHPNVVAVHEAGVHGGQVYLAMEYVDGGTLAAWLRAQPRPWQEILGVLTQAGEGLAAAHEAGLVHRDFKPQNVLMSGARARISDFGLARSAAVAEELERTAGDAALRLDQPLTRTDALLGTPAYMAPEQLRGATATPASDQFSFAVVVYEALAGHRPFRGDTIGALLAAIERGELHPIQRDIPAGVLTVLRRALAVDPARRWPDMPTLLAALPLSFDAGFSQLT